MGKETHPTITSPTARCSFGKLRAGYGAPDWSLLETGGRHLVPELGAAAGEPHAGVPVAEGVLVAEARSGGVGERIAVVGVGEVVQLGRIGGADVGGELAAGVVDDGADIDARE